MHEDQALLHERQNEVADYLQYHHLTSQVQCLALYRPSVHPAVSPIPRVLRMCLGRLPDMSNDEGGKRDISVYGTSNVESLTVSSVPFFFLSFCLL